VTSGYGFEDAGQLDIRGKIRDKGHTLIP